MSEPALTATNPEVDNLGLMEVTWNNVEFECTAKKLPQLKERSVWFVQTDKMNVGRAVCGTSEGFEPLELTTPFDMKLYREILAASANGTESNAVFKYKGVTPNVAITVPNCQALVAAPDGSENNGAATMTIKLQPKGGILKTATDSPISVGDVSST